MFTKKATKQLKRLPRKVQASARAADESREFGRMLDCSNRTQVSIKLTQNYRMIKDRDSGQVIWVGSHEDYNSLVRRGGRV